MTDPDDSGGFEQYRSDIEAAERRVAREIDPGARALVLAVLVFALLLTFILPHTGGARGIDVLTYSDAARSAGVTLPSRVFCWVALVFGVGASMLALTTARWAVAWIALAGTWLSAATGMLAIWSRQTAAHPKPGQHLTVWPGPGIGLILAWIIVIVLAYQWARVVWTRTAVQLAAEQERRLAAGEHQSRTLLDDIESPDPGDGATS